MADTATENIRRAAQHRLIETWLPLVQDANERYGWHLGAGALEALIIRAAPALTQATNVFAAHAILWQNYYQSVRDDS